MFLWPRTLAAALSCSLALSCSSAQEAPPPQLTAAAGDNHSEQRVGYDRGAYWRWDMHNVVVSAAHILVTHEGTRSLPTFVHVQRSPRTAAEALLRAQELQRRAASDPTQFAALAALESDDSLTRPLGGSLGVARAVQLPANIANALGQLRPNEISRVVETELGYHILQRLPLPADTPLQLAHIVIKHAEVRAGWTRSDRTLPIRTRAEADARAMQVARELRAAPERFAELAREYSDADDAARAGDMGVVSRFEDVGPSAVLLEYAARLEEGAISEPIETQLGFEIVQRTAADSEQLDELAGSVITLPYQGAQLERFVPQQRSRATAEALAHKLARELSKERSDQLFEQRSSEHCEQAYCTGPIRFKRARQLSALELALRELQPGETRATPIDTPFGFMVVRREPLTRVPAPERARIQLDYPTGPSAVDEQQQSRPDVIADRLQRFHAEIPKTLGLRGRAARDFARFSDELLRRVRQPAEGVDQELALGDERLAKLFSPADYERYVRARRLFAAKEPKP